MTSIADNFAQELLRYEGLQIAPAEFGNLLCSHSGIGEAVVVGVPSPKDSGTDLPRAYVVRSPASPSVMEEDVKFLVKPHLAEYKYLRGGVVFVGSLSKNAVGKFLRRGLMEKARAKL